jgi:uncharacterized protein YndB with AHSA1/START domain
MSSIENGRARAVADLAEGLILASVEIAAPPERVFRALVSKEVCEWWVRPDVFDTREWTGDVRVGGRWRASGMDTKRSFVIEGEFLVVDPPRRLVHSWHSLGAASAPTTVTYALEPLDGATRITLRHSGFAAPFVAPGMCMNICIGWETSFERLAEILAMGRIGSGSLAPAVSPSSKCLNCDIARAREEGSADGIGSLAFVWDKAERS